MTNKEAKQIISDIDKAHRNYTADEYKALEMAIQALSQEPISPCDVCRYEYDDCCEECPAMPKGGD